MMRDIRSELQQRADLCEDQIKSACAQFEAIVQQLQVERDRRISDLRGALATIETLMVFEDNHMANVVALDTQANQQPPLEERIRAVSG
jgi:hypothetical protein